MSVARLPRPSAPLGFASFVDVHSVQPGAPPALTPDVDKLGAVELAELRAESLQLQRASNNAARQLVAFFRSRYQ